MVSDAHNFKTRIRLTRYLKLFSCERIKLFYFFANYVIFSLIAHVLEILFMGQTEGWQRCLTAAPLV